MKTGRAVYRNFIIVVGLFICAGYCGIAAAYVLKGPHLLELMVESIGEADRLLIEQKLILYENSQETTPVELKETVRYVFPETFRSDIRSDSIQRIHIKSGETVLTVIDGRASAGPETGFDHYKDLLLYHSRILLEEKLATAGVDTSISSLGRFENHIAYVIGAVYPDSGRPQIWIDKESFLPLRWILRANSDGPVLEFRYQQWKKIDDIQYPMRIQCYGNGKLIREIMVDDYRVDPVFAQELFDIGRLRSSYPEQTAPKPVVKDIDEVQKTIEDFKKLYE